MTAVNPRDYGGGHYISGHTPHQAEQTLSQSGQILLQLARTLMRIEWALKYFEIPTATDLSAVS